jgi:hypothetical protein
MLVVCPAATTSAEVIFSLDTPINGTFPVKADPLKPALKATFKNDGANKVSLTLDANLLDDEFVVFWLFNYIGNANNLSVAGVFPDSILSVQTTDPKNLDGGSQVKAGLFNIQINFDTDPQGNRLNNTDSLTIPLIGAGITENDFSGLSIDKTTNPTSAGGWYSAADIRGIPDGDDGTLSGSIGAKPAAAVPEPSTVVLWSLMGVAGIGVGWWRKRSR